MTAHRNGNIHHDAVYNHRRAMDAQGKESPERVIEYFDLAILREPGYTAAWNEKANYLDSMGRFEDALSCYDQALLLDPGMAEVWFNKGLTLKKMNREKDAAACMNKGIELAIG
jgi:tetratricopeptide (TPR) repeat protein